MTRRVSAAATTYPRLCLTTAVFCLALVVQSSPVSSANVEVLYAPHDAPLDRVVILYRQAKR